MLNVHRGEMAYLLRTWTRGEGEKIEKRLESRHQPGRPRMPWTAARTTKMLKQCPLAIAQQPVYYAVAVSTAVRNSVTTTMSVKLRC